MNLHYLIDCCVYYLYTYLLYIDEASWDPKISHSIGKQHFSNKLMIRGTLSYLHLWAETVPSVVVDTTQVQSETETELQ